MAARAENKKQKKERILTAAAQTFSQKGFSRALIADIARKAEVGKGTVYEYFDSKEELFLAVFEWYMQQVGIQAQVSLTAIGGTASERLTALAQAIITAGQEMEDMYTLFMEFWSAGSPDTFKGQVAQTFRRLYGEFRGLVAGLIKEGQARGEFASDVDAEAVAATMVGAWDGLLLQNWFENNFDPAAACRSFNTVLLRGMQSGPKARPQGLEQERDT